MSATAGRADRATLNALTGNLDIGDVADPALRLAFFQYLTDLIDANFSYTAGLVNSDKFSILGIINVKDPAIGAKGDGVTDDTAAIQSAINLLAAAGGTVWIPPGTYMISQPIQMKSAITLKGVNQSSCIIKTTSNTFNAIECESGISWSAIEDLTIKAQSVGASNVGIKYNDDNGGTQNRINNVIVMSFYYSVSARDAFYSNTINNMRLWYAYNALYFVFKSLGASINNTINNVYIHAPSNIGIKVDGWRRTTFTNINVDCTVFPQAVYVATNAQVFFNGCNFEGSVLGTGGSVVAVWTGSTVTLINCQINPSSSVATGYGLYIRSDGTRVTTINCLIVIVANYHQVYTQTAINQVFTNMSPDITDIFNATGINAPAVVNNLTSPKILVSPVINLSSGNQELLLAMPTRAIRLKTLKFIYNVASSPDAGINLVLQWGTSNQYVISTITTEINKTKWSSTNGTLTNTVVNAGIPLILTCAGNKVGLGSGQIYIEYWDE